MPPMPPPGIAGAVSFFGCSVIVASVGRTHMLATVSLSSWCEVWPTGLAATKKRVSNRRVVSAFGVIQWLTHAIEVVSSRRPCSPARARTST